MIEMVTLAEARLAKNRKAVFVSAQLPQRAGSLAEIAPILRGATALPDPKIEGAWKRLVFDFRGGDAILNFVNGAEVARYAQAGVITPDHTIRTKNWPLIAPAPDGGKLSDFRQRRATPRSRIRRSLQGLFRAQQCARRRQQDHARSRPARDPGSGSRPVRARPLARRTRRSPPISRRPRSMPSPPPRRSAASRRSARQTCSIANIGRWNRPSSARAKELPLAGQIAVVTGAAGAIGFATAKAFAAAGAEVALLDLDGKAAQDKAKTIGGAAIGLACDVTDDASVRAAFDRIVEAFGGVDIVVSNAGAAWQGRIGEVDDATLRQELRAEFLRSSARRAERGAHHAGAGHGRLPAVQRLQAGDQSRGRISGPMACRRPRRCSSSANMRSTTAPTASAPTRSMPTASAPVF